MRKPLAPTQRQLAQYLKPSAPTPRPPAPMQLKPNCAACANCCPEPELPFGAKDRCVECACMSAAQVCEACGQVGEYLRMRRYFHYGGAGVALGAQRTQHPNAVHIAVVQGGQRFAVTRLLEVS